MDNRWVIKPKADYYTTEQLKKELGIPKLIVNLLVQRGISTFDLSRKFFRPQLTDLYDSYLMKDMNLAVNRIQSAIKNKENILVYGDYDVDGTTSVSMMYLFLKSIYNNVTYYIPDRYDEGYGVSKQGIDFAIDNNISLIISLDCGIKANEQVQYAKDNNIDFIICDHHLPSDELPNAVAILDPQRSDCSYPYKFLSGCGVGFKLIQALAKEFNINDEKIFEYLDLVAVSIAADIVPLTNENKTLAYFGLEQLRNNPRIGLKVMIPEEQKKQLTISNIVFQIAPKINAAGRIEHAEKAVELLISDNEMNARNFIYTINELNTTRKELDTTITKEALQQVEETNQINNFTTIVYNESWHKGVIGIVASRLTEYYYKPTLVFTKGKDNELVASARSVKDFDVYSIIDKCSNLLTKYGGHMFAAGLSLHENNFELFKQKFEHEVRQNITHTQTVPVVEIDEEVEFTELTPKIYRLVSQMQPFGPENMTPVFLTKNVQFAGNHRVMGKNSEHLRLSVFKDGIYFDATAFGMGHLVKKFKKYAFDLVYNLDENQWQGKTYYRLLIKDVHFHIDDE